LIPICGRAFKTCLDILH